MRYRPRCRDQRKPTHALSRYRQLMSNQRRSQPPYGAWWQHFEKQVAIPPAAQSVPPSANVPGVEQAHEAPKVSDRIQAGQNAGAAQKVVLHGGPRD